MALKNDSSRFDFAEPFDIMLGTWNGITTVYDDKGRYQASVASMVYMSWVKKGSVLRYVQNELANLDEALDVHPHKAVVASIVRHDFELKVAGKACFTTGKRAEKVSLQGTETSPGTYIFHLTFPEGDYYNNQYFSSPNERHIIGPFVPAGKDRAFSMVVAQTFTRVSYDVIEPAYRGAGAAGRKGSGKTASKTSRKTAGR